MRAGPVFALVSSLFLLAGCGSKSKQYEVNVEIERIETVRRDQQGVAIASDVTIEFGECPGQQTETFRGDKEFAACVSKLKVGEKVKATILHEADDWGEWEVEVLEVAGCKRKPEPKGSQTDFDVVQVCHDVVSNGTKIGFRCDRKPSKELLAKCPWFRTR